MTSTPLDSDTLEAVAVLARAVDRVRVPSVVEFRLLSNALRRAVDSRDELELNEAARVFQTLEPEFRQRILQHATAEAHALTGRVAPVLPTVEPPPLPVKPPVSVPRRAGSSFLAALNGLRPKPAASRDTAKDRLAAAVERQRAIPDSGDDLGYDTGLRAGAPLPRSS